MQNEEARMQKNLSSRQESENYFFIHPSTFIIQHEPPGGHDGSGIQGAMS
jgi:hypothetical protein